MIRVLIADDHQMFIDGIKSLLVNNKRIQIIGEAHNGFEVTEFVNKQKVDLILLDMSMPVMDGMEAMKIVKQKFPDLKIIMLTMFSTRDQIEKLLRAGADGYVLKNTGKEELVLAIETVMKGESFFSKEVTEQIMAGIQKKKVANRNAMIVELTEREKDVLKLIVKEHTTQEIAEKLFISTNTVETHRKNLVSKLNVRNVAGLVKYALQNGLDE
ncbi:response regulator transcription factor [Aurantibacillus circumpalustris]|uniref:response regulator transcription factor n=1 Tax=Aurantibacillus circumpalustris TaxID=3036359 RepID=UPI00295B0B33|nr:response regulator transcription factor [Aurantibacillus circumpalustris]